MKFHQQQIIVVMKILFNTFLNFIIIKYVLDDD